MQQLMMMQVSYCVKYVILKGKKKKSLHTRSSETLMSLRRKRFENIGSSIGHTGVGAEPACMEEENTRSTEEIRSPRWKVT